MMDDSILASDTAGQPEIPLSSSSTHLKGKSHDSRPRKQRASRDVF